jgi:FtsZ-interacting cell division protein YlmF
MNQPNKREVKMSTNELQDLGEVELDARRRLPLGKAGLPNVRRYSVVQKTDGTLILTPLVVVPAWELALLRDRTFSDAMAIAINEVNNDQAVTLDLDTLDAVSQQ